MTDLSVHLRSVYHSLIPCGVKAFIGVGLLVSLPIDIFDLQGSAKEANLIIAGLCGLAAVAWGFRISATVDSNGVRGRNFWTSFDVRWDEVTRIGPVGGLLVLSPVVGLFSGPRKVTAIYASNSGSAERNRRTLAILDQIAKERGIEFDLAVAPNSNWDRVRT